MGGFANITAHDLIGDIRLFDESGQLLADIRGFQCQAWKSRNRSDADRFERSPLRHPLATAPRPGVDGSDSPAPDSGRSQEMEQCQSLIFADQGGTGMAWRPSCDDGNKTRSSSFRETRVSSSGHATFKSTHLDRRTWIGSSSRWVGQVAMPPYHLFMGAGCGCRAPGAGNSPTNRQASMTASP